MGALAPGIAGALLFVAAFSSLYLDKTISTSLMVLMALAAVLISLPAIRRFELSKEGFSIEAAEAASKVPAGPVTAAASGSPPPASASADETAANRATLALGLAFLYGAVSGVASGALLTPVDPTASAFPAPIGPPAFFSLAIIAFLARLRPIRKIALVIIPPAVFVGWIAAYNAAFFLIFPSGTVGGPALPETWANLAAIGLSAGTTGAVLMAVGLSIGFRQLRSIEALSIIIAAGTLTGLVFAPASKIPNIASQLVNSSLQGSIQDSGRYLLFVSWQGIVLLSVAYAIRLPPRPRQASGEQAQP